MGVKIDRVVKQAALPVWTLELPFLEIRYLERRLPRKCVMLMTPNLMYV